MTPCTATLAQAFRLPWVFLGFLKTQRKTQARWARTIKSKSVTTYVGILIGSHQIRLIQRAAREETPCTGGLFRVLGFKKTQISKSKKPKQSKNLTLKPKTQSAIQTSRRQRKADCETTP